ncbi:hypothetical protein BgiBS90_033398 [Biomphalaria glabrata]|nr:hypothetical protein BgiBS90_033398 [Biomphalaria glabrata]
MLLILKLIILIIARHLQEVGYGNPGPPGWLKGVAECESVQGSGLPSWKLACEGLDHRLKKGKKEIERLANNNSNKINIVNNDNENNSKNNNDNINNNNINFVNNNNIHNGKNIKKKSAT